jgi:hypothetical protein
MTSCGPAVIARMHASTRTMVPALLLALGATAAQAQATDVAPLNLSLPSSALPAPTLPAPTPVVPDDSLSLAPSAEVQRVIHWIQQTGDNGGLPYLLIDKANARVYSFSRTGRLQADAPVLLGMAKGDRLLAANSATMSVMSPEQRITPAGRFISRLGLDSHGKELLVLDYDASISLHPVIPGKPYEHRAERLASATSDDNRISFGCINAPPAFYANFVSPSFKGTRGIVYVLPETRPAAALFGFRPFDAPTPAAGGQGDATALAAPTVAPVED